MKPTLRLASLLALSIASAASAQEFDHLAVDGHAVATTHGLPLTLALPQDLTPLGETHFRESYGGPSFDVSATAFASDSVLVAVHAEAHTDGTGGLDYSELPPDTLAGVALHSRVDCFDLREESDEDVDANGFLRFLRDAGYDFDRALVLKRMYLTDPEGRAEVVLSFGRVVSACGADARSASITEQVRRGARAAFGSLRLTPPGT